jgi:hypothetical protein
VRLLTSARFVVALSAGFVWAPSGVAASVRAPAGDEEREPSEQPERESPAVKIAVLPVVADDDIDDSARADFYEALHKGVGRGEYELSEEAAVNAIAAKRCKGSDGCSAAALAEIQADTGATHYVRTRVDLESRDYTVKIELVDIADNKVILESEQICEICGLGEVNSQIESQGAFIQARLSASQEGPPVLVISSEPSGALVFLDDKLVGTTPFERDVVIGEHSLRVSLNGYVDQGRAVALTNGAREVVEFSLERVIADPTLRNLDAGLLAGGLAVFGGGVVLVVLDGMPFKGSCTGDDVDPMGNCRFIYNTKIGGAVAAVSGAVAATIGVMMLIRHRKGKATRELAAGVSLNGLVVRGRF